jgi:hypothetical protein
VPTAQQAPPKKKKKEEETMPFATAWMKDIMLNEISQTGRTNTARCHL